MSVTQQNDLIMIQLRKSYFPNPAIDCVCAIPTELVRESLHWPAAMVLAMVQSLSMSSAGAQREAGQMISSLSPPVPADDGFLSPCHASSPVQGVWELQQSPWPRNSQGAASSQQVPVGRSPRSWVAFHSHTFPEKMGLWWPCHVMA